MKIAFITYLYPHISFSGGSSYAFNLVKEIAKHEEITVFIPKLNIKKLNNFKNDISYHLIETKNILVLRSLEFMINVAKKIKKSDVEIVHSNAGAGAFVNTETPFIETFHHWPKEIIDVFHATPMRMCLKKANIIIAVSDKSRKELPRWCNRKKIYVVENGVDDNFLREINEKKLEKLIKLIGIKNEKIILNINTEVSKRKNLPLMLDTIRYLKMSGEKVKLLLIAPEKKKKKVYIEAKRKKVEKEIIFIPAKVPYEEMPYYYSIADFVAIPSRQEGFGLPLIEGIAMNKPFVSFKTGIAPELEKKGFGYTVSSEEEFKQKCLQMLREPIEIRNGKKFVMSNYSWKKTAEKVLNIYRNAIK